jgi:PAS domain-containing protein
MLVASARNEEELAISRRIGSTSVMLVPLVARGKTVGVVSFVSTESGKRYDERDLALAEEVGRRAGVALDNARLYRQVQQSRDQLDIILQGVADGILVYAPDSRLLYANEAGAQMNGYASVQELLAAPPLGIVGRYELIDEQGQPFPTPTSLMGACLQENPRPRPSSATPRQEPGSPNAGRSSSHVRCPVRAEWWRWSSPSSTTSRSECSSSVARTSLSA